MRATLLICLLLSASFGLAHKGKHETVKLPPFELNKMKSKASLRITEVKSEFVVAFTSPQYNFLQRDVNSDGDKKQEAEVEKVLVKLKNPAYIFSTKTFQCAMTIQPDTKLAKKTRTLDPKMSLKIVKIEEKKNHTETFHNVAGQYKLKCKNPITYKGMVVRIFNYAPYLDELSITFDTKLEGKKSLVLARSEWQKEAVKKSPKKVAAPAQKKKSVKPQKNK